jgi:hypothetical protein
MANTKNGNGLAELGGRLWAAADQLWANSSLRPSEYSAPVLGLIFLRFADNAFTKVEAGLKDKATGRLELLAGLGWQTIGAFDEVFGAGGTLGRVLDKSIATAATSSKRNTSRWT